MLVRWLPTATLGFCGTIFPWARSQEASSCPLVPSALPPGAASLRLLPTHNSPSLAGGAGQLLFAGCCWRKLTLHLLFSPLGLEMTSQAWRDWAQVSPARCCCHALLQHKCSHTSARDRTLWGGLSVSLASLQLSGSPEKASTSSTSCHGHAYAYIHYKTERLFRHASISEYFHLAANVLVCLCFLLILWLRISAE